VDKRLREEVAKIQVEINAEKSRLVDLSKGESFGFLGFEFRRVRSWRGKWRPYYAPKRSQRTALLRKLKPIFRRFHSQPLPQLIEVLNPILRGWVHYFAIGDASRCFSFVKDWVEKKVRRHLMRARNLRGFGWERWSKRWFYDVLGLFNQYQVRRAKRPLKALPAG
jgi:RNA-directed DNA polymerase